MNKNDRRNEEIASLVNQGMTYAEVAENLKVSRQVVAGVIYRNRENKPDQLKVNNRAFRKVCDGALIFNTAREAANHHGITISAAWSRAAKEIYGWHLVR